MRNVCVVGFLTEQGAKSFLHFPYATYLNVIFACIEYAGILLRDDDMPKAELLRFRYTLLDSAYRAHLTTKSNFPRHAPILFNWSIYVAGEDCRYYAQVHRQVVDAQSSCDVEEHIFLHQLEAYPFSNTANSMLSLRCSKPVALLWGVPYAAEDTKAWVSTRKGRTPSMAHPIAQPDNPS